MLKKQTHQLTIFRKQTEGLFRSYGRNPFVNPTIIMRMHSMAPYAHGFPPTSLSGFPNLSRMEQAARLLKENPGEKIYKIAERTGFVSSKHFISVFKKYYGTTPSAYVPR